VTIDGPSGSGKSTVGQALADRMGATFVDTGLMYRALTLAAIERGLDPDDAEALEQLADRLRIEIRRPPAGRSGRPEYPDSATERVLVDGRDATEALRTPAVDRAVSAASRHPGVRRAMLGMQRAAAAGGDTVMVGRDIGSVVIPDATLKVYLTAPTIVRARRRAAEMGQPDRLDEYRAEIERRDALDSTRSLAPLRVPDGALVLDTGALDVEACVAAIAAHLPSPR
jgi:cytidylate kinase